MSTKGVVIQLVILVSAIGLLAFLVMATKNYCTLFSSKNRNEWNHKKMLLRMRSNTVKLKKKQKHTTEWPYTATVYLFDALRNAHAYCVVTQ